MLSFNACNATNIYRLIYDDKVCYYLSTQNC